MLLSLLLVKSIDLVPCPDHPLQSLWLRQMLPLAQGQP
jgi:hypothetical protein